MLLFGIVFDILLFRNLLVLAISLVMKCCLKTKRGRSALDQTMMNMSYDTHNNFDNTGF